MKKGISMLIVLFVMVIIVFIGVNIFLNYNNSSITTAVPIIENIVEEIVEPEVIVKESTSIEGKYNHDEYQQKIDEVAKEYGAVGVSVALVDDGKVIDTFSYGSAIKGQLPMTENTKVRIASISKVFLGLATMISVENETMSLDEDIGTYWGF